MKFDKIKTIQIHIPKTGGTTITYHLANHCFGGKIKNDSSLTDLYKDPENTLTDRKHRKAHVIALECKTNFEEYDDYYSFAIIRNPLDQISSLYNELRRMNPDINPKFLPYKTMSFEDFILKSGYPYADGLSEFIDQKAYVVDEKDSIIVDDIFLFEDYKNAIKVISNKTGVKINANKKLRSNYKKNVYSKKMENKIKSNYKHVFEFYNYIKK